MLYGQHLVALCIPRIHEGTNHKFITSLNKHLIERNCRLLVYTTPSELYWNSIDEQGEKSVFELINYNITDAIIIHDEAIKNKEVVNGLISKARQYNIPVITLGGEHDGCTIVKFDYSTGFESVVRHVLRDHHVTDFHFIAGIKGNEFSEERIQVVRKVARELDVPFSDEDVSYGEFWSKPTEEAVEALFTRRRRLPRAIICANDSMAITTVNVLKRHGIKVPENVIVTGFDGISDVNFCTPRITTCLCNNDQLAECVAQTTSEKIAGARTPDCHLVVPVLQKSESCGCKSDDVLNASEELTYLNNSFTRYQNEEEHMFRMISRIMECHSFTQVADILDKYDFYDMVIMLNPECLDSTFDPLSKTRNNPFGEKVKIIYNTNYPLRGRIEEMETQLILPNLKDMLTEHDEPLLIFSLNYMGLTMGYCVFNYHNYDIQNYYKASQIVNTLNCAFGAYRTIQYQHYLSEKIEEMYRCDGLTHLLNRLALKNSYGDILKCANGKLTVVLADLDHLKYINDNYGHDDGDFAICTVADALKRSSPENALCVRWGGDEMVAVIPGVYSGDVIRRDMNKYIEAVNSTSDKKYSISASVGVMTFDTGEFSAFEDMVRATDQMMYSEKNRKRAAGISDNIH